MRYTHTSYCTNKTDQMEKIISVVLPCFNQGVYLSEALDSLIGQTYENWEAIVVNDGSSDCTERVALTYVQREKRIRYICQENKGVSAARNLGVSISIGDYILPLDPDDRLAPDYMEQCLAVFKQYPDYTLVYTQTYFFGIKAGIWGLPPYHNYKSFLLGNCIVCTSLFRKEDFLRIGGYDENMHIGLEDWELYIRLLHENRKVYQVEAPLFFYRIKDVSRNTECSKAENIQKVLRYIYKKHFDTYVDYFGFPLDIIRDLDFYKRKYVLHHNKWYRKIWRRIRGIGS